MAMNYTDYGTIEDDTGNVLAECVVKSKGELFASSQLLYDALSELRQICSDIPAIERNPKFAAASMKALRALSLARGDD